MKLGQRFPTGSMANPMMVSLPGSSTETALTGPLRSLPSCLPLKVRRQGRDRLQWCQRSLCRIVGKDRNTRSPSRKGCRRTLLRGQKAKVSQRPQARFRVAYEIAGIERSFGGIDAIDLDLVQAWAEQKGSARRAKAPLREHAVPLAGQGLCSYLIETRPFTDIASALIAKEASFPLRSWRKQRVPSRSCPPQVA